MLRQLDDDQHVHQALAVATVTGQPRFLSYFLAVGIGTMAA